jgi:hypothetical protein
MVNGTVSTHKEGIRNGIMEFESHLASHPNAVHGDSDMCPVTHKFADGMYIREIFIPKGVILTGKIHKHSHGNFLMEGEVIVFTEGGGEEHLIAPMSIVSLPGTKRVVKTLQDTVWVTVHANPTNTQDLVELEKEVIAETYEEFEAFQRQKALNTSSRKIYFLKRMRNRVDKFIKG